MNKSTQEDSIGSNLVVLPNGIRVIALSNPTLPVDYFGVNINVGSREDPASMPGMAHFLEHMIFKGTKRRSSHYIINRVESLGGELNAYTTKEETVIYAISPAGYLNRSAALISELITESNFPEAEVEKERDVILDEINSYLDNPAEAVIDDFEEALYLDRPLSHNILGTKESVTEITGKDLLQFLDQHYVASNIVVFYYGSLDTSKVIKVVDKYFSPIKSSGADYCRQPAVISERFSISRNLRFHQSHTILGSPTVGAQSDERYAILLLSNILGGPSMNSLLNMDLREKRGLVYTIESNVTLLSDTGSIQIYYGCDPEDCNLCKKRILRIIDKICNGSLTDSILRKCQKQYLGQLTIAAQNAESRALSLGRSIQIYNKLTTKAELNQSILNITAQNIVDAATKLCFSQLTLL